MAAACAAAGLAYVLVTGRGAGPAGDTAVAERPAGASEVPLAADVDSSGAVDIFDAYLVARAVRGGDVSGLPDLDGDGQTTQLDADLIAARAVELPR